jgi:hypothetical protein
MSTLAMGKNVEYNDFIDYVKKYLKWSNILTELNTINQ